MDRNAAFKYRESSKRPSRCKYVRNVYKYVCVVRESKYVVRVYVGRELRDVLNNEEQAYQRVNDFYRLESVCYVTMRETLRNLDSKEREDLSKSTAKSSLGVRHTRE